MPNPLLFSKGEIRTLDLTGMSRALSPAELPCHNLYVCQSLHKHHFLSSIFLFFVLQSLHYEIHI